jgi:hypothetical protein
VGDALDPHGGDSPWWQLDGADDAVSLMLVLAAIALVVLIFTTVLVPVIAMTVELVLFVVLFLAGLAGRLLFRRPWTVRATDGRRELAWQAVGFQRSGRVRDEAAQALAAGRTDVRPAEALAP